MKNKTEIPIYPRFLPVSGENAVQEDRQWQMARDRVLAYLNALDFSAVEALELCVSVMDRARTEREHNGKGEPVAASMQILRRMLQENMVASDLGTALENGGLPVVPPVPELNRASMISEHPFPSLFSGMFPFRKKANRTLQGFSCLLMMILLAFGYFIL